jgi:cytochrome P450
MWHLTWLSSFAGSDSTASTMQSFMYHILKSSAIYNNIVSEIDAAESAGKLSPMITYTEAQALPYLQAALKEAMRVRPAVGLNITRHVPPSGAEIDGQWYPGDTRVLHKDKGIFGQDGDVYRPERWLEGGEAKTKAMDRHMYQVSATRLCQLLLFPVNADDCV